MRGKGSRCVGLTPLPPSCADCLEIWETELPRTFGACQACNGIALPFWAMLGMTFYELRLLFYQCMLVTDWTYRKLFKVLILKYVKMCEKFIVLWLLCAFSNYQLNAQFFYFSKICTYVTLHSSTCFEQHAAHPLEQWRTERGLGCSNPHPPEIPKISVKSSNTWARRAGVSNSFCSSLCSHTIVIY